MNSQVLKRNNVSIIGEGEKTIVFGHGLGCDQLVWRKISQAFKDEYRLVFFDYVGSGQSDKEQYSYDRYSTLYGYQQDLLEVCDALELESIIFIGHSVSSMIGALASIERPGLIEKLIMIGPSPHFLNKPGYHGGFEKEDIDELLNMMEINYKEWAKYLAPIAMQNSERPELTSEFEAVLSANDPMIIRQFAEVTFTSDLRSILPDIKATTLILQPQFDALVPLEIGNYIHKEIADSHLVVMDAAGHNPHISDAKETIRHILAFLTSQKGL
ncbi:alpha/beta hydrolase [Planococcus shenhongbingii]|uniref:alpha/beta fold hydrolase n=1 Tax=Planococcus shenhongbingii TaxID=3058398 RepID=UPI00263239D7|nr:alpha/beta hydrolase [Planococcus sp. N016]WKA58334.1 alpha/beta hydrolase [Planococcus sp. N016]